MGRQAKIFRDWTRLVMSCAGNGEQFPGLAGLQANLEARLAQGREAGGSRKTAIRCLREMVIPPIRGRSRKAKGGQATIQADEKDDPAGG